MGFQACIYFRLYPNDKPLNKIMVRHSHLYCNASNTDRPPVGRCRLVSSDICVQVTLHAEFYLKPQDTGYHPHLSNLLFYLELSHCKLRERGGACPGRGSSVSPNHVLCPSPHHLTSPEYRTVAVRSLALKCLVHLF